MKLHYLFKNSSKTFFRRFTFFFVFLKINFCEHILKNSSSSNFQLISSNKKNFFAFNKEIFRNAQLIVECHYSYRTDKNSRYSSRAGRHESDLPVRLDRGREMRAPRSGGEGLLPTTTTTGRRTRNARRRT